MFFKRNFNSENFYNSIVKIIKIKRVKSSVRISYRIPRNIGFNINPRK